jgi:hypothetical protein
MYLPDPPVIEVANDKQERLYPNTGICESLRKMSRQVPLEMEEFDDYSKLVKKIQSITGTYLIFPGDVCGCKLSVIAGDQSTVGKFDMMQHRDHMVARKVIIIIIFEV